MGIWQLYGYDVLCLAVFAGLWFAFAPDFKAFSSNASMISVSKYDFCVLGIVGIYAVRISSFITIAQHNKPPHTAEWLVTIIGLCFAVFMWLFGGFMIEPYAGLHGYKFCSFDGQIYNFAKQALLCPAASH
jgi:hypothetical protein